jgi:hypothetical protein
MDRCLATNNSPAPLSEQEQMRAFDAKEMESSSKINLRDVSWWKSMKDAWKPKVWIIIKL